MTYDLINNIVPLIRFKVDLPLTLPTDHPLQVCVACPLLPANPSILQLGEMAFKEANLMFIRRTRYIRAASLDTEMIVHRAGVDRSFGLRNELGTPHIRVPFGGAVDGDFGALLGVCVARIFVRGRQVDV